MSGRQFKARDHRVTRVKQLLAQGVTPAQIAYRLDISVSYARQLARMVTRAA